MTVTWVTVGIFAEAFEVAKFPTALPQAMANDYEIIV